MSLITTTMSSDMSVRGQASILHHQFHQNINQRSTNQNQPSNKHLLTQNFRPSTLTSGSQSKGPENINLDDSCHHINFYNFYKRNFQFGQQTRKPYCKQYPSLSFVTLIYNEGNNSTIPIESTHPPVISFALLPITSFPSQVPEVSHHSWLQKIPSSLLKSSEVISSRLNRENLSNTVPTDSFNNSVRPITSSSNWIHLNSQYLRTPTLHVAEIIFNESQISPSHPK